MEKERKKIEEEIAALEKELAEKKAVLEKQKEKGEIGEIPPEREILKEVLKEKIAVTPTPTPPQAIPPTPPPPPPPPKVEPPSYLTEELKPKVQELVNITFGQSLEEAIKLAKATNNSALIDAFHDIIVDELYNVLLERKKLKEVK